MQLDGRRRGGRPHLRWTDNVEQLCQTIWTEGLEIHRVRSGQLEKACGGVGQDSAMSCSTVAPRIMMMMMAKFIGVEE